MFVFFGNERVALLLLPTRYPLSTCEPETQKKPGEIEFYVAESFVPINCLPSTHEIGGAAFVARLRTCVRVIRKVRETLKAPQNRKTIPEKIFEWENN